MLYCEPQVDTCAAEIFQATRRIDRIRNAPALAVFALQAPVTLLDLRGAFATRIGASTAIHSGPRSRARAWTRQLYEAYPNVQGFQYGSSMNGHAPAIVLNERAQGALPKEPQFTAPSTTSCWSMCSNESPCASRTGCGSCPSPAT